MFEVQSLENAKNKILSNFKSYIRETELVSLEDSIGREVAVDLYAKEPVPHFNRSTVDGYAVKSSVVAHASEITPIMLKLLGEVDMGEDTDSVVTDTDTVYVPTGGALPEGADAVVMIEVTEVLQDEVVVQSSVTKNENVLRIGSDIQVSDVVLEKGKVVNSRSIGVLAAAGITEIEVFKPLTCIVISTGDEIVSPYDTPKIGEIRDINTLTITSYLQSLGISVAKKIVISDNFELYKQEVLKGFKYYDFVVTSGGSSVGVKDYTIQVLESIGAEIYTHGINIKPGKPTILGNYKGKFFFGLPGQPLSAYVVLIALIDSFIESVTNRKRKINEVECILSTNIHAAPGRTTYQLVKIDKNIAAPIFTKSGMISGLSKANGYVVIEDNKEGLRKDSVVKVKLL